MNFTKFKSEEEAEYVTLADKSIVKAVGKGSVNLYLRDVNGKKVPVAFENVLYVPNLERLISITQLTERGEVEVTFKKKMAVMQISGRQFIFGTKIGKLYKMNYCNFAAVKEPYKSESNLPSISRPLYEHVKIEPVVREENSDKIGEENTQIEGEENSAKIDQRITEGEENTAQIDRSEENTWKIDRSEENTWKIDRSEENTWKIDRSEENTWKITEGEENTAQITRSEENTTKIDGSEENTTKIDPSEENTTKIDLSEGNTIEVDRSESKIIHWGETEGKDPVGESQCNDLKGEKNESGNKIL